MKKLSLGFVLVLALIVVGSSCKAQTPPKVLSIEEVVAGATGAAISLNSYSFNLDATGSLQPSNASRDGSAHLQQSGFVDKKNQRLKFEETLTRSFNVAEDTGTPTVEKEYHASYVVDGTAYWGESKGNEELRWNVDQVEPGQLEDSDFMAEQLSYLQKAQTSLGGTEKTRGRQTYVVDLQLDIESTWNYMILPVGPEVLMFEGGLPDNIQEFTKAVSFRQYYDADTFFLMKVTQHLEIVLTEKDDSIFMTYDWSWQFDDHNKSLSISPPKEAMEATFSDPDLEDIVRAAIGKPAGTLNPTDLASLTELVDPNTGVQSLKGIQYCTNLRKLDIWVTEGDLSPLASLSNLTTLSLGFLTETADFSPLRSLSGLTSLSVHSENLTDLALFASLPNLTSLDIDWNPSVDISVLSTLSNLTELSLDGRLVSDISRLPTLPNLTSLGLLVPNVKDISRLASMGGLSKLKLNAARLEDISPLSALGSLTDLSLTGQNISRISSLASLTNLKSLSLEVWDYVDISPLGSLVNLGILVIYVCFLALHLALT